MKIEKVQAFYPEHPQPVAGWRKALWQIVVRVETDLGLVGYGYGGGGLAALPIVNHHFQELIANRRVSSVADIGALWDLLYKESIPYGRKGITLMALSGLDLALWDVLGKAEGVPVYELLGGLRKPQLRAYATGTDPEYFAELGFTAFKFPHRWRSEADYETAVEMAALGRASLGREALVMADCYMSWDANVVRRMSQVLAPYNLYWFEDVATPDDLAVQATLRSELEDIQLAGGEHEFGSNGFAEIARYGALDIWQPDITWCGGLTAGMRIVELAKENGARVVPHRGGEVWGLHLIAATECEDLVEVVLGHRNSAPAGIWRGEPTVANGMIAPTERSGFGVELAIDV